MALSPKYTDLLSLPPPPRAAEFNAAGRRFRLTLWGALLVACCIFLGVAAWNWQHAYTIDAGARTATARVLAKEERGAGDDMSHYVRFSFRTAAGDEIEAEQWARPEQYDSVSVGQELPVHYFPENPTKDNWLLGYEETRKLAYRDAWMYVHSLIPAVLIIALVDWAVRRERRLARRGEFVVGRITDASTNDKGKGTPSYGICFEFTLPSGEVRRNWCDVSKEYFEAKGRAGEAVGVLYDPRRPWRCQALPALQFVTFPTAQPGPVA